MLLGDLIGQLRLNCLSVLNFLFKHYRQFCIKTSIKETCLISDIFFLTRGFDYPIILNRAQKSTEVGHILCLDFIWLSSLFGFQNVFPSFFNSGYFKKVTFAAGCSSKFCRFTQTSILETLLFQIKNHL